MISKKPTPEIEKSDVKHDYIQLYKEAKAEIDQLKDRVPDEKANEMFLEEIEALKIENESLKDQSPDETNGVQVDGKLLDEIAALKKENEDLQTISTDNVNVEKFREYLEMDRGDVVEAIKETGARIRSNTSDKKLLSLLFNDLFPE